MWAAYLRAKKAAEVAITETDLDWTILRPGSLTDDPATGRITLAPPPMALGPVTRADTAATLVALLDEPGTVGQVLELREGDVPVDAAVKALA